MQEAKSITLVQCRLKALEQMCKSSIWARPIELARKYAPPL
jgi:hypothetical protein